MQGGWRNPCNPCHSYVCRRKAHIYTHDMLCRYKYILSVTCIHDLNFWFIPFFLKKSRDLWEGEKRKTTIFLDPLFTSSQIEIELRREEKREYVYFSSFLYIPILYAFAFNVLFFSLSLIQVYLKVNVRKKWNWICNFLQHTKLEKALLLFCVGNNKYFLIDHVQKKNVMNYHLMRVCICIFLKANEFFLKEKKRENYLKWYLDIERKVYA